MSENLVEKYATKTYIDKDYKDICIREDLYLQMLDKVNKFDKQKEVLDKIKEYITTRTPSDIGISGNKPKKYYTLNEDEVDYILELLEGIE